MASYDDPEVLDALNYLRIEPGELMKQQAKTFDAKKSVWIPTKKDDLAGYIAAEVEGTNGDKVQVKTERGEVSDLKIAKKHIFIFCTSFEPCNSRGDS